MAELFLQRLGDRGRARFQRHANDGFVLPARKQIDRVDRIVRRLHADEPGRDLDVLRPDQILDDVHRLELDQLRSLESRAGRRTQAELNLLRFHRWKDLRADSGEQDDDQDRRHHHVASDHEPSKMENRLESIVIGRPQPIDESGLLAVPFSQHPCREHRHQSAREQIR